MKKQVDASSYTISRDTTTHEGGECQKAMDDRLCRLFQNGDSGCLCEDLFLDVPKKFGCRVALAPATEQAKGGKARLAAQNIFRGMWLGYNQHGRRGDTADPAEKREGEVCFDLGPKRSHQRRL